MNIEIANRLVDLRKKSGLSQEELAAKLGLSRQAVSKWERAEASPDTDNLICLAKLYGVSLDDLLDTDQSIDEIVKEQVEPENGTKAATNGNTTEAQPNPSASAKPENGSKDTDSQKQNDSSANDKKDSGVKNGVHIDADGIHFNDDGDDGYIDSTGIHIHSKNGEEVHIDAKSLHAKGAKININVNQHKKGWALAESLVSSLVSILAVAAYVCLGLFYPDHYIGWGVCWLVLFLIPLATTFVAALRKRSFCAFSFPVLVVGLYIMLGMVWGYWGTAWPIFFAIPVYYIIFGPVDNVIHQYVNFDDEDNDGDDDEEENSGIDKDNAIDSDNESN
jgi:transcriptional regulator with XRE-family HTH domain